MKKITLLLCSLVLMAVSCKKPIDPIPAPPKPEPDPVVPELKDNVIYMRNAQGETEKEIKVVSASSFCTSNGYLAFYLADIPGLNKTAIQNQSIDFEGKNVIAANIMFPLNGQEIQLDGATQMRYMLAVSMTTGLSMDFENSFTDEAASSGCFTMSIDRETNKAVFELDLQLADGSSIYVKATSDYTPGGENESIFLWGDYSRPVLAAFYEKSDVPGFEPTLYMTSGQIDYGEDIPRTTYAKISPATSICDGEKHDIAQCIANGTLNFFFRDFDSEWNIVSGEISIKVLGGNQYEVAVGGLGKEIHSIVGEDKNLNLYYKGVFKDKSVERDVPNIFNYNGADYNIHSVVIDITSDVASIYFCQSYDITTTSAAEADNPVKVTVSKSKWTSAVGLSTDKDVFSVSYDGNLWNKDNLDTGSYIVHQYDETSGLFHCQLANICLKTNYKTVIKLEYKGHPAIIR